MADPYAEPSAPGPKNWAELGRQQEQNKALANVTPGKKKAAKPKFIVLKHGDKEMRRWELPSSKKDRSAMSDHARAFTTSQDFAGQGSYFSAESISLGNAQLKCAPVDMLLAPAVRGARDAAYAAAIAAGHSPEIASAAAAVAVKAVILRKPLNVALLMAAATAQALADGYSPRVATACGVRAGELFENGFSPGAALTGGRAYAEAMSLGHSPAACDAASLAAAVAADAAGAVDEAVALALSRGDIPPDVLDQTVAAGAAAADAIKTGGTPRAAAVAGKAASKAIKDGYSKEAAAAAGASAATAIMAGRTEEGAMAAGEAAAQTIASGGSWEEAMMAGAVASEAFDAGMTMAEALAKGQRVAAGIEKYSLMIVDEKEQELEEIPLDIDASQAVAGADTADVETEVEAYLDLAFTDKRTVDAYKDSKQRRALKGSKGTPAAAVGGGAAVPMAIDVSDGGGGGAPDALVASGGTLAGGSAVGAGSGAVLLERAVDTALLHAMDLEENPQKRKLKGEAAPASGGGCVVM